jgi:hypothetical protein
MSKCHEVGKQQKHAADFHAIRLYHQRTVMVKQPRIEVGSTKEEGYGPPHPQRHAQPSSMRIEDVAVYALDPFLRDRPVIESIQGRSVLNHWTLWTVVVVVKGMRRWWCPTRMLLSSMLRPAQRGVVWTQHG